MANECDVWDLALEELDIAAGASVSVAATSGVADRRDAAGYNHVANLKMRERKVSD